MTYVEGALPAPRAALGNDPFAEPDFTRPPTGLETAAAAFRLNNPVLSLIEALKWQQQVSEEPGYGPRDILDLLKGTPDENNLRDYAFDRSRGETIARLAQRESERRNGELLAASGIAGLAWGAVGGVFSPEAFLPAGAMFRAARGGYSALRTARSFAAGGAAQAAIAETILQNTQERRDWNDGIMSVSSAAILAGLLGAGAAKFMTAAERAAATRMLDEARGIAAAESPAAPASGAAMDTPAATTVAGRAVPAAAGAAPTDTRALDLEGFGLDKVPGLGWALSKTDPLIRTFTQKGSTEARRIMADLAETALRFKDNAEGVPTALGGPPVDRQVKMMQTAVRLGVGDELEKQYSLYRFGGEDVKFARTKANVADWLGKGEDKLTPGEFSERVYDALHIGDDVIPQVKAAADYIKREVFDPIADMAVKAKMFGEHVTKEDLLERFAPIVYDRDEIARRRGEFVDRTTGWYLSEQDRQSALKARIGELTDRLTKNRDRAAKIDAVLGRLATRETGLRGRLTERAMEAKRATSREGVVDERAKLIAEEIEDLQVTLDELRSIASDPASRERLADMEKELAALRQAERRSRVSPTDLDKVAADVLRSERAQADRVLADETTRIAAEMLSGKRSNEPKVPTARAFFTKYGIKPDSVGADDLRSAVGPERARRYFKADGDTIDDIGLTLSETLGPGDVKFDADGNRVRFTVDEVVQMIAQADRERVPSWWRGALSERDRMLLDASDRAALLDQAMAEAGLNDTSMAAIKRFLGAGQDEPVPAKLEDVDRALAEMEAARAPQPKPEPGTAVAPKAAPDPDAELRRLGYSPEQIRGMSPEDREFNEWAMQSMEKDAEFVRSGFSDPAAWIERKQMLDEIGRSGRFIKPEGKPVPRERAVIISDRAREQADSLVEWHEGDLFKALDDLKDEVARGEAVYLDGEPPANVIAELERRVQARTVDQSAPPQPSALFSAPPSVALEAGEARVAAERAGIKALRDQISATLEKRRRAEVRGGKADARTDEAQIALLASRNRLEILGDQMRLIERKRDLATDMKGMLDEARGRFRDQIEERLHEWKGDGANEGLTAIRARERYREARTAAGTPPQGRLEAADAAVDRAIRHILDSDKAVSPQELRARAEQTVDQILGGPAGRLGYDWAEGGPVTGPPKNEVNPNPRGSFNRRAFNLPYELRKDFLVRDLDRVMDQYVRTIIPDLMIAQRFGDVEMKAAFQKVRDDFTGARDQVRADFQKRIEAAPDAEAKAKLTHKLEKEMAKLQDAKDGVEQDIAAVRDRIRGVYAMPTTRIGRNMARGAAVLRTFSVIQMLGRVVVNSLSELTAPTMRYGFERVLGDGWAPLAKRLAGMGDEWKHNKAQLRAYGVGVDMELAMRHDALNDLNRAHMDATAAERMWHRAGEVSQIVNLQSPYTDMNKRIMGTVAAADLLERAQKVATGKATKDDLAVLAENSIDPHMARAIWKEIEGGGGAEHEGVWLPNTADWKNAAARQAYEAAVAREADIAVVSPGQEKPLWMSQPVFGLAGLFNGFTAGVHHRGLIANLQRANFHTLAGVTATIAMGTLSYAINRTIQGKPIESDPSELLKEGISRSGVLGWFEYANKQAAKLSSGKVDLFRLIGAEKPLSRYESQNVLESLLGPASSHVQSTARVIRAISTGEVSSGDVSAARRLVAPLQNHFLVGAGYDAMQRGMEDLLGVQRPQ